MRLFDPLVTGVREQVQNDGYSSVSYETLNEVINMSDEETIEGLSESVAAELNYFYEIDENDETVYFAEYPKGIERAKNMKLSV